MALLKSRIKELLQSRRGMPESPNDIEFLERYLQKNDDKKIEIEDIAQLMGYTSKYMRRLFKQKMGTSFIEYRLNQKMNKAKQLLAGTDWPIKQIAYSLTYENPESFVRIFKKRTGLTPSQYRQSSQ